jgi:hypothetical protein
MLCNLGRKAILKRLEATDQAGRGGLIGLLKTQTICVHEWHGKEAFHNSLSDSGKVLDEKEMVINRLHILLVRVHRKGNRPLATYQIRRKHVLLLSKLPSNKLVDMRCRNLELNLVMHHPVVAIDESSAH